jgi:hypothetical protein
MCTTMPIENLATITQPSFLCSLRDFGHGDQISEVRIIWRTITHPWLLCSLTDFGHGVQKIRRRSWRPGPRKAMRTVACIPDDVIFNILSQLPSKSVIRYASPYARPGLPSSPASTSSVLTWISPGCDRQPLWSPAGTWDGNMKGWIPLAWVSTGTLVAVK